MFHSIVKPRFYKKSKSLLRLLKTRLETIKKKKNAVQKFMKNDIADLLRNNLDINAYGRAEGLLAEQNISVCYDIIEKCIDCILLQVPLMQKETECPNECREAVPTLVYAAARFADLPELRELRGLFNEKYGNSLDSYVNKQFVGRLNPKPPSKETKVQLLQDVAREFSIDWDSKPLQQKLYTPDESKHSKSDYNVPPSSSEDFSDSTSQGSSRHKDSWSSEDDKPYQFRFFTQKNTEIAEANNKQSARSMRKNRLKFHQSEDNLHSSSIKENLPLPPGRTTSVAPSQVAKRGPSRSKSMEDDIMMMGHVHPKLPDYDDLAARLSALRKK